MPAGDESLTHKESTSTIGGAKKKEIRHASSKTDMNSYNEELDEKVKIRSLLERLVELETEKN